jgi:hypothetical protein
MESGMPKLLPVSYTFFHWRAASGAGAIMSAGTLMKESEALPPYTESAKASTLKSLGRQVKYGPSK